MTQAKFEPNPFRFQFKLLNLLIEAKIEAKNISYTFTSVISKD